MAEDETGDGNEYAYAVIFIIMFLPPLALLLFQVVRTIRYHQNRKTLHQVFWVLIDGQPVLNKHLALKAAFALVCALRVLQGFLFIVLVLIGGDSVAVDSLVRYWLAYIITNVVFTCTSILMYYWLDIGLVKVMQFGKATVFPKNVTLGTIAVNILFHVLTLILLSIFMTGDDYKTNIEGNADTKEFQVIYFFAVSLPMLLLVCSGNFFVRYSIRKLENQLSQAEEEGLQFLLKKAYRKMGIFTIALIVAFAIRVIADIAILFANVDNVDVRATLVFAWNAIPELILCYTLCILTWVRKSTVKVEEGEGTRLLSEEIIVPEIAQKKAIPLEKPRTISK